ncbi:unnamed protein product [Trichobilharzia szidati]|nr:unnamed protein product [Trichobilharzia szidati]
MKMGKHYNKCGGLVSFRKAKAKQIVEEANRISDIKNELNVSFEPPDNLNVMSDGILSLECIRASKADDSVIDELMSLLQQNMQDMYTASSWGWNAEMKRGEAFSSKSWLIICRCRNVSGTPECCSTVGFVSFRFEREEEHPVLYCYEIQLYRQFQHLHVGTFLMEILSSIALAANMHRVVLTVFKSNVNAVKFFRKLGFKTDETDPSMYEGVGAVDYLILSKLTGNQ